MTQLSLFGEYPDTPSTPPKPASTPSADRFEGALVFSAIGDALGWPTEFILPGRSRTLPFAVPVHDFVSWKKVIGGKWWGYDEEIMPGQYSDDTQLTLAVARCITEKGVFEPERFAYQELPLWLQYERGGGKSIKTAARRLITKRANWLNNFYRQGEIVYTNAGANGAAMRNLPIALANIDDDLRLVKDSFFNAIITHGHPRAILGAILFAWSAQYLIKATGNISAKNLVNFLEEKSRQIEKLLVEDERANKWISSWNRNSTKKELAFLKVLAESRQEATGFIQAVAKFSGAEPTAYYRFVGALKPESKGSGLATVCAAIFLFLKYLETPLEALHVAVNMFGSDTDTIAAFVGALFGSFYGLDVVTAYLLARIQDEKYLRETALRLRSISAKESLRQLAIEDSLTRKEAYLRILAWEMGLHEMFWDAIDKGGIVYHPTMGRGTITQKVTRSIRREDYIAKLISIEFDCGQSCVFHSRVAKNYEVTESLATEIEKALK